MRNVKAVFAGLAAVSVSVGAISGRVTDTSGTAAIPGALVHLETGGQSVTTDGNGNFTIPAGTAGIFRPNNHSPRHSLPARTAGGLLDVNVAEGGAVEIAVFDINGRATSAVRRLMSAGTHTVAVPQRSAGVYFCRVKADGNESVLMGSSIGGRTCAATDLSSTSTPLAKQATAAAVINDVIAVTKSGYLDYRVIVTNSDTSGIAIKMIVCAGTVTDGDGNVYQTVKIGNQEWTVQNLRTTKCSDGSGIPLDTSTATWTNATTPLYCYYGNTTNADSVRKYGALYNWYVVSPANASKIAPTGWHVPSDAEWTILERYLVANGYNWDGTRDTTVTNKVAKALAAEADWKKYASAGAIGNDLTKNNASGFSALPGGFRSATGLFSDIGGYGYWWSATEHDAHLAWYRILYYYNDYLYTGDIYYKSYGFSVRLVKG